ncbi:hypothetical protein EDB85DRAFT_2293958 [Lactarius pseudohatsudake]|nr:hypothetical protein EDB85DRAFT_2293958 [Lactarius pseudohatsudake]
MVCYTPIVVVAHGPPHWHGRDHCWRAIHHEVIALSFRPTPHAPTLLPTDNAGLRPKPSILSHKSPSPPVPPPPRSTQPRSHRLQPIVIRKSAAATPFSNAIKIHPPSPRRRLRLHLAAHKPVAAASNPSPRTSPLPPPPPPTARKSRCYEADADGNQVDDDDATEGDGSGDAEGGGDGDAEDDGGCGPVEAMSGDAVAVTTRRRERRP